MKFKVGDKVRVIDKNYTPISIGALLVIGKVLNGEYESTCGWWFSGEHLEHANPLALIAEKERDSANHPREGGDASVDASVNHPKHYQFGSHEPIDVITVWGLGFNLGNTVKYVARAGRKAKGTEATLTDLKKAAFYLKYETERLEALLAKEKAIGSICV